MKKILLILCLFIVNIYEIKAYSNYVVMDKDTGRVLSGSGINEKRLIASTTKILTTIVALENMDTTEIICAKEEIEEVYGSMIYIEKDECMTLYDLLVGLNLRSGNDAAMVIASYYGYDKFIDKMNETAFKINMNNSEFKNPHGLDNETKNYSTAYDLALLMRYALNNKIYREITSIKKYKTSSNIHEYIWYNKNELLTSYKYTTGGKTGYTDSSGYVFVSSATKNDNNLIIVTFDDKNRFNTHKTMYEKYFKEYSKVNILNKYSLTFNNKNYKYKYLYIKDDINLLLKKNDKVKININYSDRLVNNIAGNIDIYVNNEKVDNISIYYEDKKNKVNILKDKLFFWKK